MVCRQCNKGASGNPGWVPGGAKVRKPLKTVEPQVRNRRFAFSEIPIKGFFKSLRQALGVKSGGVEDEPPCELDKRFLIAIMREEA
ncbi:MAG: hypothetical protein LBL45_06445 [Treponema sp.]|jgi:hypothetical protein|nr:hypothetical protein [Treponema sp.]